METHIVERLRGTPAGIEAERILRACVHCGFCTATCPTYQLLGDEKDSPRGRIYLMKQVLEGATPSASTMQHLDRCLTCRNCESTCPSGVKYSYLLDIGRDLVEKSVKRPLGDRLSRQFLLWLIGNRPLFGGMVRLARAMRPVLPAAVKAKVPVIHHEGQWPARQHARKVLLLNSCVQETMLPGIDRATARLLDHLGVESVIEPKSGCCGSLRFHMNEQERALDEMRRNIDAWWPHVEQGAEALLMNASGCGVLVKDYGHLLRNDPVYAERAEKISAITFDAIEWLGKRLAEIAPAEPPARQRVAFHAPCSLQHGQKIRGEVEKLLTAWGADLQVVNESHLCCGSAGTYSILQPELAGRLRSRKLGNLERGQPEVILSANAGCIAHLGAGTGTPVMHWLEWIEPRVLAAGAASQAASDRTGSDTLH